MASHSSTLFNEHAALCLQTFQRRQLWFKHSGEFTQRVTKNRSQNASWWLPAGFGSHQQWKLPGLDTCDTRIGTEEVYWVNRGNKIPTVFNKYIYINNWYCTEVYWVNRGNKIPTVLNKYINNWYCTKWIEEIRFQHYIINTLIIDIVLNVQMISEYLTNALWYYRIHVYCYLYCIYGIK